MNRPAGNAPLSQAARWKQSQIRSSRKLKHFHRLSSRVSTRCGDMSVKLKRIVIVGSWTLDVVFVLIEYATWSFAANKYYDGLRYLSNYSALQPVWRQNGAYLFCILRSRSIQVNLVIWTTKSVSRMQVLWIKYKFVDCHYQPLTTWAQSVQKQSFFIILSCTLRKTCHRLMYFASSPLLISRALYSEFMGTCQNWPQSPAYNPWLCDKIRNRPMGHKIRLISLLLTCL